MKYRKRKKYNKKKKMNNEIIKIVFYISIFKIIEKCLLQCNKRCVIAFPLYPSQISFRIKFYISWCKKARYIYIDIAKKFFRFGSFMYTYYNNGITNI